MMGGFENNGLDNNRYELSISLGRITPVASFKPLSTLEFLRSFVGQDLGRDSAVLDELYQLNHTNDSRLAYAGLRYTDRSLKVTAVTDLSAEVPEPGTISLMSAGLAAAGALRRGKAKAASKSK